MVLNGVHLVPGYVDLDRARCESYLFFYVLALNDLEEHMQRFRQRAMRSQRIADRYLMKIDNIRKIQDYILDRARCEGVPILPEATVGVTVRYIIRDVLTTLEQGILQ